MRLRKTLLLLLWFATLCAFLSRATHFTEKYTQTHKLDLAPPAFSRLDPRLLRLVTLGFRSLYDDYLTIATLQFLNEKDTLKAAPERADETVYAVTKLLPRNEALYMLSCFVLGLDLRRPASCERITLNGMKAVPNSWKIPSMQGFMSAFILKDAAQGASYYELAMSRPGAPAFFKPLSEKLRNKGVIENSEIQKMLDHLLDGNDEGN